MPKTEDKVNFDYEHATERLQEIKNDINIIKTHSKWVLSLLTAIALGLASFVFRDLGNLPIITEDINETAQFVKVFAGALFITYSLLIMVFIPWLLWSAKAISNNENKKFVILSKAQETEILKDRVEKYAKKLLAIDRLFKALIIASVLLPLVAATLATGFTYFA